MIQSTKRSLFFFSTLFLISFISFSQSNAKTIKGKVYFSDGPLPNANIIIKGTKKGTQTNSKGFYTIKAKEGDILQYSFLGFKTVSILVDDTTSTLNIKMIPEVNELDETVVVAKKTIGKAQRIAIKKSTKFTSGGRVIDPTKVGFSIKYIDSEDINTSYESVSALLRARYGYRGSGGQLFIKTTGSINNPEAVLWDVDGVLFEKEPPVSLDNIESIRIIKSLAGTNHYGSNAKGGVIIIKTVANPEATQAIKKERLSQNYNTDLYNEDASKISTSNLYISDTTKKLTAFSNKEKAYQYYKTTIENKEKDFSKLIDIAYLFAHYYKDNTIAIEILENLKKNNLKNPEILKAIAYQYQNLEAKKHAINTFKDIFKIRPKYAQSYRDLANAFNENEQFVQSWRTYMTALIKKMVDTRNTIGNIIFTEMEWLYFNRKEHAKIKRRFVPRYENRKDFENDIRILVEWNVSDADFELEFVNPKKQSYVFKHTIYDNETLIMNEKKLGYSIKDFIIDKLTEGDWLMNLTYLGNKKEKPTFFKVTIYYDWGRPTQKQKNWVFKLAENQKGEKLQIVSLNKNKLPL